MTTHVIWDERILPWVVKRMSNEFDSIEDLQPCVTMGVVMDGKPVCGVVFNNFRQMKFGNDVCATIVATDPRWCQRRVLHSIFDYPFNKAGCTRMTVVVKEGNARSIKLVTGLGFRKSGVLPRGFNGKSNAIVFSMLREQCKWIQ